MQHSSPGGEQVAEFASQKVLKRLNRKQQTPLRASLALAAGERRPEHGMARAQCSRKRSGAIHGTMRSSVAQRAGIVLTPRYEQSLPCSPFRRHVHSSVTLPAGVVTTPNLSAPTPHAWHIHCPHRLRGHRGSCLASHRACHGCLMAHHSSTNTTSLMSGNLSFTAALTPCISCWCCSVSEDRATRG